jgi:hypothetical protein
MTLFCGNNRGYGVGEFEGAKQRDTDSKWTPGHVRWTWGPPGREQYHAHLNGDRLLGIGPICDDNRCWFACLDVDNYDIDYSDEMDKIKKTGLPLAVFRTKSGGLRVCVFFCETVETEVIIPRMKQLAGVLGYSGCEIFPKQTKLNVDKGDGPSWIFIPYGGMHGIFSEQGCMNDKGNLMLIDEAMKYCLSLRISNAQLIDLFSADTVAKSNGKANGKKHPKGSWMQEDTYEKTVDTTFWNGPPCLWTLAHRKVHDMQNYFLLNAGTFLKKKYPENWDAALTWVNFNVLQPSGNTEKLADAIKRFKHQDYEYTCQQEPICSHCFSDACRRQPYGVGQGGGGIDLELGMTIVNRVPCIFLINVGTERIAFTSEELLTQQKYKIKCLEHSVPFPNSMKKDEWEQLIRRAIENATTVEPTSIMKTGASEIEMISEWFSMQVPTWMKYEKNDDDKDVIRVKKEEARIYFKWKNFADFLRRRYRNEHVVGTMREFVNRRCEEHIEGRGHWWRYTWSIPFDTFDEEVMEKWLNPK